MKKYNVGILGATGAVGQEMMKILAERSFPVGELRLLASRNSAGREINGHVVVEACRENFEGLDIVLGAAENNMPNASSMISRHRALCLSTTPARSACVPMCPSSFPR